MRHPPGGKGTIMVEATFTKSMHALLSRTKGSTLLSYECAKDERFSRTYGNCRIHLNDGIIEVANEPKPLPFFGAMESMTLHWSTYFGHKISKIRCQKNK